MTTMHYADDRYAKSCKDAEVYEESTLDGIFIQDVDPFICHSLQKYWTTHSQADVTDIAVEA